MVSHLEMSRYFAAIILFHDLIKSSNLDNFEHIHYYLNSSRFWPTVVNRATNNQANQSCINTACTVPNRSAGSKDGWPWRGTEECSYVGCLMELYELY
jgi:hypothetical protein